MQGVLRKGKGAKVALLNLNNEGGRGGARGQRTLPQSVFISMEMGTRVEEYITSELRVTEFWSTWGMEAFRFQQALLLATPESGHGHSSPAGRLSSIRRMNLIRISVTPSPFRVSWTNLASTAIWTISKAPRSTPHKRLE